jgi:hypothetical protein
MLDCAHKILNKNESVGGLALVGPDFLESEK